MKGAKKNTLIFSVATLIFSTIIFFLLQIFLWGDYHGEYVEENFIEPTELDAPREVYEKIRLSQQPTKKIKKEKKEEIKVRYAYLPASYKHDPNVQDYTQTLQNFFDTSPIKNNITFLENYLYKDKKEVRGRMKNKKVHIFGATLMSKAEFLAVSIHEFGHFFDLYILKKGVFTDVSDYFYNISWENTKTLKKGMSQKDFISGYAMTNKYEDFAETFTYYILHNSDFREKMSFSSALKKKYDFFNRIFNEGIFQTSEYKTTKYVKKYYWDTTKIEYNLDKFLWYISNWKDEK